MEISYDELRKDSHPYQLFLNSLSNPHTYRKYKNQLVEFLKLVPSKIYEDALGKTPQDREPETLAEFFVKLAKKDPDIIKQIISQYIRKETELVKKGEMSANTLPNHIKPIKSLLDANGVMIHWKSLYKLYPRANPAADDRAYTTEEIQKMLEVSSDITDKVIILMFSSGGFRLESWNYFTWKDLKFFKNKDGTFRGAALLVYRGDPESYFTFLTPECCIALNIYREKWKSDIGSYPKSDDPVIRAIKYPIVRRLNALGVKKRLDRIVKSIGLRPPLPDGKRRHEVQLDHGFRKFFNTMLRRAKVDFLDKEDMMGHSTGLEKHYERYTEQDFERFSEYQKAIPYLTISDKDRISLKNQQLEEEKSNLEKKIPQLVEEALERIKQDLLKQGWTRQ